VDSRTVKVIGTARNGWMSSFAHASHRIARAITDGRITVADIDAFPAGGYNRKACRALAEKAGMSWETGAGGDAAECDAEDIEVAVEAIAGLASMRVCTYDETGIYASWILYPEDIAEHDTTIQEIRRSLQGISLVDAAALIVAADDWYRGKVQAARVKDS
jgi:hypothetical protein